MARKPRSQWSPAYRRRVERAEAKGKTRQQARGHKPREHIQRRQSEKKQEKKTGALTSAQRQRIKRFAERQARKVDGADPDEMRADMIAYAQSHGFKRMQKIMDKQAQLHRQYKNEVKRDRYASRGVDFLDIIAADDFDTGDVSWFFYH